MLASTLPVTLRDASTPIHYQTQCPRRKTARYYGHSVDLDQSLVFSVLRMEVRRRVIVVLHLDPHAIEAAEFRHEPGT